MIRPFTCLAFLLACGSGLYLYQSKHRVKVLDEQIAQTVRSTDALREQTRMLSAEWTLLNDPERLRQLASQFLTLQTVSPNQFTSLAELDSRLPAPVPPSSQPPNAGTTPADQVPVALIGPVRPGDDEGKAADTKVAASTSGSSKDTAASGAAPPAPGAAAAPRVAMASPADPARQTEQARAVEHRPPVLRVAPQPRLAAYQPHSADQHAPEFRAADPRASEARGFEPRPVEQRVAETRAMAAPRVAAPAAPSVAQQSGGSMLGMAHGMSAPPMPMPLPRPMPVSAPNWSYSNGG